MVIAPEGFRDEEYFEPKEVFEANDFEVITASKKTGTCIGKLGGKAASNVLVSDADPAEYDAVVFVGGPGMARYLEDSDYTGLAKKFFEADKLTTAICISPSVLANAGILSGKKATAFPSEEGNLKSKGADWTGQAVTKDGKVITANGPDAAKEFAEEIVNALG